VEIFQHTQISSLHQKITVLNAFFSGGAWTPATKVNDKDVAAICIFSAKTLATLKKGKHDKAVPVTVDETLSYKSLFEGLNVCAGTSESE